jgi:urease accessory protein
MQGVIENGLAQLDIPLLCRLHRSVDAPEQFLQWNQRVLASRETRELRLEEQQMGRALWRLLRDLDVSLPVLKTPSWLGAFALAAQRWNLECRQACLGFLWNWLENQLTVAAKTVPIGQTDVQRISQHMLPLLVSAVDTGMTLEDDEISGGLPAVVMASMLHETQYSRLFRS